MKISAPRGSILSGIQHPRLKNALQVLAEDEPPLIGEDLRRFIDRSWVSYRNLTRQQGTPAE